MGSGCLKNNSGTIKGERIYDVNVIYTGENIPELGICNGDSYDEIILAITDKLLEKETYQEIINTCSILQTYLGERDPILRNVLDVFAKVICGHANKIEALESIVFSPSFIYDLNCLVIEGSITTEKIVQELINKYCNLQTQVNNINSTLSSLTSTISILDSGISNIIAENGKSVKKVGNTIYLSGFLQPYMPQPYIGPLSNFDSSGKGIASLGWKDWYIMNGNNGTQDWRGFTFAGATNVPGPTLHPMVNPLTLTDSDASTSIGDRKGKVKNKLNVNNLPNHTHNSEVTVKDHSHIVYGTSDKRNTVGSGSEINQVHLGTQYYGAESVTSLSKSEVEVKVTSVAEGATSAPIENRQPTVYGYWVVWIPN